MKKLAASLVGAGVATGLSGLVGLVGPVAANAQGTPGARGGDHAVFVQTDNPDGNQIAVYDRSDDGTLTAANTYDTGGNGGVLNGSVVDHLASQGSLTYDAGNALLYAVNAGATPFRSSVSAVTSSRSTR